MLITYGREYTHLQTVCKCITRIKVNYKCFAYFYNNLRWAVSTPGRLTTVSNMNLEAELGKSLIVQICNGSKIRKYLEKKYALKQK